MSNGHHLARMLRVLSSETRIRLLQLLAEHPYCVNALADRLELSSGAISQHLKILREAGLVEAEKHGYYLHYSVVSEALVEFKGNLESFLISVGDQLERQSESGGGSRCLRKRKRSARNPRS